LENLALTLAPIQWQRVWSRLRNRHAAAERKGQGDMRGVVASSGRARGACAVAFSSLALLFIPSSLFAGGDWPDSPYKSWFENLRRPDNDQNLNRDYRSLFCCGVADTVKTKFKVELGTDKYPEDRWYAWIQDTWIPIPAEKIVKDYAPDGQAYLFMMGNTVQCFVRPKGGL
jgi:hypothetical protein